MVKRLLIRATLFVGLFSIVRLESAAQAPKATSEIEQLDKLLNTLNLQELRTYIYDHGLTGDIWNWVKQIAFRDAQAPLLYLCVKKFIDDVKPGVLPDEKERDDAFFALVLSLGRAAQDCIAFVRVIDARKQELKKEHPGEFAAVEGEAIISAPFKTYVSFAKKYHKMLTRKSLLEDGKLPAFEGIITRAQQWFETKEAFPTLTWVTMLYYGDWWNPFSYTIGYSKQNIVIAGLCEDKAYQHRIAVTRSLARIKYFEALQKLSSDGTFESNASKWNAFLGLSLERIFVALFPQETV